MPQLRRLTLALGCSLALLGGASGQTPQPARETAPSATLQPPAPPSPEVLSLRGDLRRLVEGGMSQTGVMVVSLDRGDTLFSASADLPLAPASNMKLYSTAAALYYLGPEFRWSTYLLGTGEVRDGVLQGDLVLYGTGDPSISARLQGGSLTVFRALADSLAAHGVREVAGNVVGDGSYFDDAWTAPGWGDDDRMASYGAPIGALSFAENVTSIRILPGGGAGAPARIRTTPETSGMAVDNQVRTVASGRTSIRFEHGPGALIVRGQIARRHPGLARSVPVTDPGNFAAAAFRALLDEKGIRVHGGVRGVRSADSSAVSLAARSAPAGAAPRVLAVHLSPTLVEIATVTNHISHNLFAEALLKTVGRVALGEGSFEGGAKAVRYFLECEGATDPAALRIVDGSGLSVHNRVTARTTVQLLDLMRRTGVWEEFHASLPEAASREGGNHSLRHRMGGTPAAGNLRAKTGTIGGVSSLSGYVRAANGELLAFSILANGSGSTWAAKRIEDAIGARLARFSRGGGAEAGAAATAVPAPSAEPATETPVAEPAPTPQPKVEARAEAKPEAKAEAEARPKPAPKAAAARTHRVRSGETLDGIAKRYDTTVRELQRLNPGLNPRRLQIGQRVKVPG